jgi:hypothetical protein
MPGPKIGQSLRKPVMPALVRPGSLSDDLQGSRSIFDSILACEATAGEYNALTRTGKAGMNWTHRSLQTLEQGLRLAHEG